MENKMPDIHHQNSPMESEVTAGLEATGDGCSQSKTNKNPEVTSNDNETSNNNQESKSKNNDAPTNNNNNPPPAYQQRPRSVHYANQAPPYTEVQPMASPPNSQPVMVVYASPPPPGSYRQQGNYQQGNYPQGNYPQGNYPQGPYPQGPYPQGNYPQGNYPTTQPQPLPPPQPVVIIVEQAPNRNFVDPKARREFIAKVYGILFCQLLFMFGCVFAMTFIPGVKQFTRDYPGIGYIVFASLVVCMVIFCCGMELIMKPPWNYVILVFVTLTFSLLTAFVAGNYAPRVVLISLAATSATVFILTIMAFVIKKDLTVFMQAAIAGFFVVIILSLLVPFVVRQGDFKIVNLVLAYASAVIFCVFIVIDTQMLMDGKRYSLSPDMAVFAAITLFLDIVCLLLIIFQIVGGSSGD